MNSLTALRESLIKLKSAYEFKYQMLKDEHDCDPLQVVDMNGRAVLLDALTTIVNAETVLVSAIIVRGSE